MVCDNVRPPLHKSLSCLLGWCYVQGLRCHFISMSGKSPMKLEVTSRHDHSCLLGRKASNQTNKIKPPQWGGVKTASLRRFLRVTTIYVLSKNKKNITFFVRKLPFFQSWYIAVYCTDMFVQSIDRIDAKMWSGCRRLI